MGQNEQGFITAIKSILWSYNRASVRDILPHTTIILSLNTNIIPFINASKLIFNNLTSFSLNISLFKVS